MLAAWRRFIRFCTENGWSADGVRSIERYASFRRSGVAISTVVSEMKLLRKYRRMSQRDPWIDAVQKELKFAIEDQSLLPARSVDDATHRTLTKITSRIADLPTRVGAKLMLALGRRACALEHLNAKTVRFVGSRQKPLLVVDLLFDKNIRDGGLRRVYSSSQLRMSPEEFDEARDLFAREAEPLREVSSSAITAAMKAVKYGAGGRLTASSLRRNFIHRAMRRSSIATGVVDYDAVARETGHRTGRTLETSYRPSLSNFDLSKV